MPIKLNAAVCEEMGGKPITEEDCEVTKEFVVKLANKLTLDGYGQAYLKGLYELPENAGEEAFIIQGKYISNNCSTEMAREKTAWYILSHLEKGKSLPVYKRRDNVVTEIELEHLCTDITNKTVNAPRVNGKIPLKVFEDYAEMHNVSLDKVLVCQDWVDEILTDEVIKAKEKAKKKVKILWE